MDWLSMAEAVSACECKVWLALRRLKKWAKVGQLACAAGIAYPTAYQCLLRAVARGAAERVRVGVAWHYRVRPGTAATEHGDRVKAVCAILGINNGRMPKCG